MTDGDKPLSERTFDDFIASEKSALDKDAAESKHATGSLDELHFYANDCARCAENIIVLLYYRLVSVMLVTNFARLGLAHQRFLPLWGKLSDKWPQWDGPVTFGWHASESAAGMGRSISTWTLSCGFQALDAQFGKPEFPAAPLADVQKLSSFTETYRTMMEGIYDFSAPHSALRRDWTILRIQMRNELNRAKIGVGTGNSTPAFEVGVTDLSPQHREAFEKIRALGKPAKGKVLADHINVAFDTFRKYYVPALKRHGLKNGPDGYYISPT